MRLSIIDRLETKQKVVRNRGYKEHWFFSTEKQLFYRDAIPLINLLIGENMLNK